MQTTASRAIPILFAAAALALSLWLFPLDCDGAAANYDGARYGIGAERFERGSISPHHPLFHVLAFAVAGPLRALHVPHAGQYAVRTLSGAGAAWILLQILALAGNRRILTGAAFAVVVFSGAGFLVLAGTGETVLPGAAAALFVLVLASRAGTSWVAVSAALTLALLLRQDNLFVVPGVVAGLAAATPAGSRLRTVAKVLATSAFATVAGYVASWIAGTGGDMPFFGWLIWLAQSGSWSGQPFGISSLAEYLGTLSRAMTGPFWSTADAPWWTGALCAAAILAAGILLRGSRPIRGPLLPIGLTLSIWALFHSWWLASNYEWLVPPVALLAAAMAGLARGEPATPPVSRAAGIALLIGLAGWVVAAGAPHLARFRERRLAEAVEETAEIGRGARYLGVGGRAQVVLEILGLRPDGVDDRNRIEDIIAEVSRQVARSPARVVVIIDRFTIDPAPRSASRPRNPIDMVEDRPPIRFLRRDGIVYGAVCEPAKPESR
jgi:hypothetical protein